MNLNNYHFDKDGFCLTEKLPRFSFKQKRKFSVHLDYYIYSKILNFYHSFFN